MENVASIGEKISLYRKKMGISQEWFAEELGISQQTVSDIEKDKTDLTVKRLQEISRILKVPTFELMSEKPQVYIVTGDVENGIGSQYGTNNHYINKPDFEHERAALQQVISTQQEMIALLKEKLG